MKFNHARSARSTRTISPLLAPRHKLYLPLNLISDAPRVVFRKKCPKSKLGAVPLMCLQSVQEITSVSGSSVSLSHLMIYPKRMKNLKTGIKSRYLIHLIKNTCLYINRISQAPDSSNNRGIEDPTIIPKEMKTFHILGWV